MGRIGKIIVALALLVIVGSFLAPVAYFARLVGRGRAVEMEIARIRQSGEPVSKADLIGEAIPDDENAANIYMKCFSALPRRSSGAQGGGFAGFQNYNRDGDGAHYHVRTKVLLKQYSDVLAMAEKAAAMPRCKYPPEPNTAIGSRITHSRGVRALTRMAAAQALVEARDGRTKAAVRYLQLAYRIADSLSEERNSALQRARLMAIGEASRAVAEVASVVHFSEDEARDLSAVIDGVNIKNSARYALEGDRVVGIAFYGDVSKGAVPATDAENASSGRALKRMYRSLPGRTWLYSDELFYLSEMRQRLRDADLPYRVLMTQSSEPRPEPPRYLLFANLLLPRLEALSREIDRAKSDLAGARIFLGILAYRDHFGSYPPSLESLEARLNWQMRDDPFSGKPFVYRRQGMGFILYSIGDDLKDSDGKQGYRMKPGDLAWMLDK